MEYVSTLPFNTGNIQVYSRPGDLPAVVFLHGSSMSSRIWEKQWNCQLWKERYLLAIDLTGHGASARSLNPDHEYSLRGYTQLLLNVLREMKVESCIIAGLSLGGNITIEVLPDIPNCRGIFLTGTGIAGKPAAVDQIFLPNPVIATVYKDICTDEEVEALIQAYFSKKYRSIPAFMQADFRQTDPKCRTVLAQSVANGHHQDEVALLRSAAIPVAFMTGTEDQLSNIEYVKHLRLPLWQQQVQLIPGAGHMPQWENPEAYNERLAAFIENCLHPGG